MKAAFKAAVASGPGWAVASRLLPASVAVLAYHRIGPPEYPFRHVDVRQFAAQMRWLRRHCEILAPDGLRAAVADRAPARRLRVLVTFDDGYADYAEHAYPVLRALDIPAIVFVPTGFVDDGRAFWWDVLHLACQRTAVPEAVLPWGVRVDLRAQPRLVLYRACQQHLKPLPDAEVAPALAGVLAALGVTADDLTVPRQVMTWDQIRATRPLTTYGGHLHDHPIVPRIDAARLAHELEQSAARFVAELGAPPRWFAYPNGDATPEAKAALRHHGYEVAFSITEGMVPAAPDWFEVPRIVGPATVGELAWRLARFGLAARRAGGGPAL